MRVAVPFIGPKLKNFGSIKDEEKEGIKRYLEDSKSATNISSMTIKMNELSKTTSKYPDMGLKFFGFILNLITTGPELLRKEIAEPNSDHLKEKLLKVKNKSMEEISIEAIDKIDLPKGYDLLITWYYNMFLVIEDPEVRISGDRREDVSKEMSLASNALQEGEPTVLPLYNLLDTYANRVFISDPELTFVINFLCQIFVETLYGERYHITKDRYNKICKESGQILSNLGDSLKKRDRIETYNNIFKLFQFIENEGGRAT